MSYSLQKDIFEMGLSNGVSLKYPSARVVNKHQMATMPCSHLVDWYKLKYISGDSLKMTDSKFVNGQEIILNYEGYVPKGEAIVHINDNLLDYQVSKWKEREPESWKYYVDFDPRFTLSSRSSVECDRVLKVDKWNKIYSWALGSILNKREDNLAYEMAEYWIDQYWNNFIYDDHTDRFVTEHASSHPCGSGTWGQIRLWHKLDTLADFTEEVTEHWFENFSESGDWCLDWDKVHIGNRGRSPKVRFQDFITWLVKRARQIGYMTGPSSLNAFVHHDIKVKVMRYIFDQYETVLNTKIYSPKTEGGNIYLMLRDAYLSGKHLYHFDVSGMEQITPTIIWGKSRHFPLGLGMILAYMGNIPELLSGVAPTSDWDMIAHLEIIRYIFLSLPSNIRPLFIIILGDDATFVFDQVVQLPESPLYEPQLLDDLLVRSLGLTTREWMHPVGRNITIDRADRRINMLNKWDVRITNSMPYDDRLLIAEFFTGSLRGQPLHEILKNAPPIEFVYSPKEMVLVQAGLWDLIKPATYTTDTMKPLSLEA